MEKPVVEREEDSLRKEPGKERDGDGKKPAGQIHAKKSKG
jgi:hypothetical protein